MEQLHPLAKKPPASEKETNKFMSSHSSSNYMVLEPGRLLAFVEVIVTPETIL